MRKPCWGRALGTSGDVALDVCDMVVMGPTFLKPWLALDKLGAARCDHGALKMPAKVMLESWTTK